MATMTRERFLWHDFETFGADPRRDRPCQFAAIATDDRLEPVDEPVVLYCQPTSDLLPTPDACLITGITPQLARKRGLPEPEFAARIHELMNRPGTCSVGYNNFRFDDEVTRFLFWRNFLDPYGREFRNGNSRFDLIDLLRLTRALRPEGMHWHHGDDGAPGFRLEDLARANGLDAGRAHDALVDVGNTLELARLVRHRQPRLWRWALSLRARGRVDALLASGRVLLHASSRYPASDYCIAPVLPLFRHPHIATQWLVWNLRENPAPFESFDADTLEDLMWTPTADLPEGLRRLPVKWVRANRCPMLAPTGVLDAPAAERTGIDLQWAESHAVRLRHASDFVARLRRVLGKLPSAVATDADTALYGGFVPDDDRRIADRIAAMAPGEAAELIRDGAGPFRDERLAELLVHYVGRHAPERLPPAARTEWEAYRRRRLLDDPELGGIVLAEYRARIEVLRRMQPERLDLLDALSAWPAEIGLDPVEEGA
jgi:exodeoxyribonuclease-1